MLVKLRICTKCGFIGTAATEFRKCEVGKIWNICKVCDAKRAKHKRRDDPEKKHKIHTRNSKYNITSEYFDALLAKQCNKCAICHKVFTNETKYHQPWVDHDHSCCPKGRSCGRCIRGLLCANCNKFLGHIYDNPEIAENMANYLRVNEYTRIDAG